MTGAARDLVDLRRVFAATFGHPPAIAVRAPGRVNLIGEHVDYLGLPVLPIAIDRRVTVLARPRDDHAVRAVSAGDFPERQFTLPVDTAPFETGDWGNYPAAAVAALTDLCPALAGVDLLVASDLPVAGGLSSSSALVVGVALAALRGAGCDVDPLVLAGHLAGGERLTGTMGGGMDQAICLLARHGHASRIEFDPLRTTHVPVPDDWRFVVADSLQPAAKSGAAQDTYNARTREAETARLAVAGELGVSEATWTELVEGYPVGDLLAAARAVLDGALLKRCRHIVTEAERVVRAERALAAADLIEFGAVLEEGHASLAEDLAVSTPALDQLVEVTMTAGAAGARITGAGLGGCIVAVCTAGRVPAVLSALERSYYQPLGARRAPEDRSFSVEASAGAAVIPV